MNEINKVYEVNERNEMKEMSCLNKMSEWMVDRMYIVHINGCALSKGKIYQKEWLSNFLSRKPKTMALCVYRPKFGISFICCKNGWFTVHMYCNKRKMFFQHQLAYKIYIFRYASTVFQIVFVSFFEAPLPLWLPSNTMKMCQIQTLN